MQANAIAVPAAKTEEQRRFRRTGLKALYFKELRDYFRSKRFLILLILVAVVGLASVYSATQGIQSAIDSGDSSFIFLKLFTSSGDTMLSFVTFMSLLGPIVGLALGFDAINGERSHRTLSRLLAQPIYRDAVINGKFLAGVTVIGIMVFALGFIISGIGILVTGIAPLAEELGRIIVFLFFTTVYISFWLGISMLFSLVFRHSATSALTSIAVWLFFAIFLSLLAGLIANALFPATADSAVDAQIANYKCNMTINRISPTTLYNESVSTILDPNVRTTELVLSAQLSGAVTGPLPFGQSLLLVWPHLTGLLAFTLVCFAVSYVVFMRQEIRAD